MCYVSVHVCVYTHVHVLYWEAVPLSEVSLYSEDGDPLVHACGM